MNTKSVLLITFILSILLSCGTDEPSTKDTSLLGDAALKEKLLTNSHTTWQVTSIDDLSPSR